MLINFDDFPKNINFLYNCRNAHQPCDYSQNFPLSVESKCKQQYVYRNLLAINAEGKPVMEHFQFPSCCKCMVTTSRSYARFGGDTDYSDKGRQERLIFPNNWVMAFKTIYQQTFLKIKQKSIGRKWCETFYLLENKKFCWFCWLFWNFSHCLLNSSFETMKLVKITTKSKTSKHFFKLFWIFFKQNFCSFKINLKLFEVFDT